MALYTFPLLRTPFDTLAADHENRQRSWCRLSAAPSLVRMGPQTCKIRIEADVGLQIWQASQPPRIQRVSRRRPRRRVETGSSSSCSSSHYARMPPK